MRTRTPRCLPHPLLMPIFALALLVGGCGPTVKSQLPQGGTMPSSLALLPSDYSVDIPRERIDLVRQALINELRNRHFVVLDDAAVAAICSSPSCPERAILAERYLIDGFVSLSLNSFARNNFIAGYYNELSGEVSVYDRSNKLLVTVKNTQNEEGGLLLQSGQIFQAIISSVKNTQAQVFETLADKFAFTVTEQLPSPQDIGDARTREGATVALTSATSSWKSPMTYQLCARGTPHSFAYLVTGKSRASLKEVAPGQYCGNFSSLVAAKRQQVSAVELRSPFGTSVRQDVPLPSKPACDLTGRVVAASGKVSLACSSVGGKGDGTSECPQAVEPCALERIVLFTSASPAGPFQKVADVRSTSSALPPNASRVHVMAIGAGGVPSLPVAVENK